ncbi:ankyrin repeat domain-containing protein 9 [Triplophysa rosa]|uniref:Ankyrin repeat domain 9 n=1 Tax=Triplophysa rosa TaxID=992332 RepID=A0A9W7TX58_TRIRA|nr:ankyrin repeat domain-containing protein 9 [Triplophysa rosa]KAI7804576.1 Ankyrin repeat domain 9 [Triplophysa rosa]
MPLDLGMYDSRADYKSQKQCQKTSFAFYQAVRDLLPVWVLEDMRTMEVFHWEEDGRACAYSPSEAFLYALVHDHQQYARYLLNRFSVRALEMPSRSFCCCQASTSPHLAIAARYNRINILKMIMGTIKDFTDCERQSYLNRHGCFHTDGSKTALHLACDLVRPECLILLLGHGASPYATDVAGNTPLDGLLNQICQSDFDMRSKHICLGYLILFMPKFRFQTKRQLLDNADMWKNLIGEQAFRWLSGSSPPSLFVQAMQKLSQQSIPIEQLNSLPEFLKPLGFRLDQA